MLSSLRCVPQIKLPTRITTSSATLIDHIYTNNMLDKTASHILLDDISDHLPVRILLNKCKNTGTTTNTYIRETRNFTVENFLIDLPEKFQKINEKCDTAETQCKQINDIFHDTLNKHALMRKLSKKEQKNHKNLG